MWLLVQYFGKGETVVEIITMFINSNMFANGFVFFNPSNQRPFRLSNGRKITIYTINFVKNISCVKHINKILVSFNETIKTGFSVINYRYMKLFK